MKINNDRYSFHILAKNLLMSPTILLYTVTVKVSKLLVNGKWFFLNMCLWSEEEGSRAALNEFVSFSQYKQP